MKKNIIFPLLLLMSFALFSQENQVNQPIENFEALWSKFDSRYANFELKGVDWKEIYKRYRPQITEQTTNQELFYICCEMLQTLNDGHVLILPKFKDEEAYCGPPYEFQHDKEFGNDKEMEAFLKVIDSTLRKNGFSKAKKFEVSEEGNFEYRTAENWGYLRLDEMPEQRLNKLNKALDNAMTAFQNKKGLIVDLRFNGGGWDKAARKLASRLVAQKHFAYSKKTRKKGTNEFSKLKSFYIKPHRKQTFTQPIIILTSDFSASATEVFLLSIKDLPYVTIIGDSTEGIFSDMFYFRLPNKWIATLSHQQYFSSKMENFEGAGIEPDIKILNSKKDIENQADPVIEKALEVL